MLQAQSPVSCCPSWRPCPPCAVRAQQTLQTQQTLQRRRRAWAPWAPRGRGHRRACRPIGRPESAAGGCARPVRRQVPRWHWAQRLCRFWPTPPCTLLLQGTMHVHPPSARRPAQRLPRQGLGHGEGQGQGQGWRQRIESRPRGAHRPGRAPRRARAGRRAPRPWPTPAAPAAR